MERPADEARMALDPRPGERVYQEIKQAILSGEFVILRRLDIDKLASQFGVSATPVRYALAILAAEHNAPVLRLRRTEKRAKRVARLSSGLLVGA